MVAQDACHPAGCAGSHTSLLLGTWSLHLLKLFLIIQLQKPSPGWVLFSVALYFSSNSSAGISCWYDQSPSWGPFPPPHTFRPLQGYPPHLWSQVPCSPALCCCRGRATGHCRVRAPRHYMCRAWSPYLQVGCHLGEKLPTSRAHQWSGPSWALCFLSAEPRLPLSHPLLLQQPQGSNGKEARVQSTHGQRS